MLYEFSWSVARSEVLRAGLASDLGLVAFAMGWLIGRRWGKTSRPNSARGDTLSSRRLWTASILTIILGLLGIAAVGRSAQPGWIDLGAWASSGYITITRAWAPWGMCLVHCLLGFPIALSAMTVVLFLAVMLFSYSRTVVLTPAFFLVLMWFWNRGRRSQPLLLIPLAVVSWLGWLTMKPLFYSLGDGMSSRDAMSTAVQKTFANFGNDFGSGIDFQFLDMIGSTMTLVDVRGDWYWGSTLAPLFVSPVPRTVWPEKPALNQYQLDLDVPGRRMARMGMTAGLVGEAYANGGWVGIFLTCLIVSVGYSVAYVRVKHLSPHSPRVVLYLLFLASSVQVYRDGLVSLVWYPFIYAAPMGWTVLSHWVLSGSRVDQRAYCEAQRLCKIQGYQSQAQAHSGTKRIETGMSAVHESVQGSTGYVCRQGVPGRL